MSGRSAIIRSPILISQLAKIPSPIVAVGLTKWHVWGDLGTEEGNPRVEKMLCLAAEPLRIHSDRPSGGFDAVADGFGRVGTELNTYDFSG